MVRNMLVGSLGMGVTYLVGTFLRRLIKPARPQPDATPPLRHASSSTASSSAHIAASISSQTIGGTAPPVDLVQQTEQRQPRRQLLARSRQTTCIAPSLLTQLAVPSNAKTVA